MKILKPVCKFIGEFIKNLIEIILICIGICAVIGILVGCIFLVSWAFNYNVLLGIFVILILVTLFKTLSD